MIDFANGKVHICKDCIRNYVYKEDGSVNLEKFKEMLMMINAPFYSQEFETACKKKKDTVGIYMRSVYLNHKGAEFKNSEDISLYKKSNKDSNNTGVKSKLDTYVASSEIKDKWGYGYRDEEYYYFEKI